MSLSSVAPFTTTENPPAGCVAALGSGIEAVGGIGQAVAAGSAAAMSYATLMGADQEAQVELSFTTFQSCAVYGHLQTAADFTDDHYRVELVRDTSYDTVKILKRLSASESQLGATTTIKRGRLVTGNTLKIRIIDAGTVTIVQAWVNGYLLLEVVDTTSPIQGSGYTGVWLAASSSGMGVDNFQAGALPVVWVTVAAATSPTQSIGNDTTGAGTFASPFQTIKKGADNTSMTGAGQVCMVRGGDYWQRHHDGVGDLTWRPGTSWDNPTTIQSFPGEAAACRVQGDSTAISFSLSSANKYIQVLNLSGIGGGRLLNNYNNAIDIRNAATYIRIQGGSWSQYNETGAFTGKALASEGIANYHIEYIGCEVHHNGGILPNPNNDHGIYLHHPGTIIEYCHIHNNAVWGVHAQNFPTTGDPYVDDLIIRFNRIHANGGGRGDDPNPGSSGGGVLISYGDGALIYCNLIYDNATDGVQISSNSTYGHPPENTLIFNNTFYKNLGYGLNLGGGGTGPGPDVTVSGTIARNNILYLNTQKGINQDGTRSDTTTLSHNLNPTTGAETDPVFVSETVGAEDFHLDTGSPAIGAGTNLAGFFNVDYDGLSITSWDQGALTTVPVATTPVNIVPASIEVTQDTQTAIAIDATDTGNDIESMDLTCAQSLAKLNVVAQGAAILTGLNTNVLTIDGTQAEVLATVATLLYTPPPGATGSDTLTVLTTDAGAATDSDNIAITITARVTDAGTSTVVAVPTEVDADGVESATITVTLLDAVGVPLAGHTVTLDDGAASSSIGAASGPSDGNGQVTFVVTNTTVESATYTATDTTDTVVVTQTATVNFLAPIVVLAPLTIDFKQEMVQRFPITMPGSQTPVGGGATALQRWWRRPRYEFALTSVPLTRAEKDTLESFLRYHQGDIPFLFDGGDFGIIQNKQLFGIGTGTQQDFFLLNDRIVNASVTVYEDGVVQAGVTITDATGLVHFTAAPALNVVLEAIYQCTYKVYLVNDSLNIERVAPQLYRVSCTLREYTNA